jgi:TatD DNase family protein
MEYIDTHCHLAMDNFQQDRIEIINKYFENGGIALMSISTNREDFFINKTLCEQYENIYTTLGWHPHDAKDFGKPEEQFLIDAIEKKLINAIGEIGLDYFYNLSLREEQIRVFEKQMNLAKKYKMPAVIHTREAEEDTINILKKYKSVKGILHCYTSNRKLLQEALKLDWYISFSGIITFPKSTELREMLKLVPIDRIMFETDSPYLAPVPFRGKRNDPLKVQQVIKTAADILEIKSDKLSSIANENFFNFLKGK